MLLVTHEMDFAQDVADRIIFISDSRIVEQGPPQRIFENPQTARLQSFLARFRNNLRNYRGLR